MEEVPDVYCDQFTMGQSAYGITFVFSLTHSTPPPATERVKSEPQVIVRMSLEHAKVMAMMIRKNLKQYELEHLGDPIRIPSKLWRELGLPEEDW